VRVLIVYGSSRGGTAGLAQMIAEAFVSRGIVADVGEANAVDAIDAIEEYDAVIVGGALYSGRWHPDATWFVERNLEALRAISAWFFSSGPLDTSARSGALAPVSQVQDLARQADIRGHMTFGGYLEAKSSGFLSSLLSWGTPGDYRDSAQVNEWVDRIITRIGEPRTSITLPDAQPTSPRVAARVLRRLAEAGDNGADASEDLGLDVLTDW
jgi:menaquinone-dependent protoporphyrinogen oxidase